MGNRVAVMRAGVLQQVDTPQRLYDLPANLFVASFVGSPAMNLLEGEVVRTNGGVSCKLGQAELELPAGGSPVERYAGRRVAVGIRPEELSEAGADARARLTGRVLLVESLGAESLAHLELSATPLDRPELADLAAPSAPLLGEATATVRARLAADTRVRPGDIVDLAVDPRKLYFFDLDSGEAIRAAESAVPTAVAG